MSRRRAAALVNPSELLLPVGIEVPVEPRADKEKFSWGSLAFLSPAFVLLGCLSVIPLIYAVYLGFTNDQLIGPNATDWHFTGFSNVSRLLNDHIFSMSVWLTLVFIIGSVVGVVIVGLVLAMLIQRVGRAMRTIVGGIVVVAWMMPAVSAGMTWYASTTAGGTFATLIGARSADFLNSQPLAVVTTANVWSTTGFAMLVLGAGLRNIPGEVLEAADVEDASRWQRFRYVTLPLLMPTIVTVGLLVFLLSLANFALIYVMTQGGPGSSTDILPIYSYQQAFQFNNLGYGALVGDALVLLATIVGIVYVRFAGVDQ
jgi:multiple sugar transport system permease protein